MPFSVNKPMKQYIVKIFSSFCFIICIVPFIYGQTAASLNGSYRWVPMVLKATDVNPSFLFSKEYLLADIVSNKGKAIAGNKFRLNLQDSKLYYLDSTNEEMEVLNPIKRISFVLQEGNKSVATFEKGFPPIGKLAEDNFYQVLVGGKISLLLDTKFIEVTRIQVPVGPVKEVNRLENYYGTNGTVIVHITKPEEIVQLMPDKAKEITDYIQKEKIKIRKQSDLIKVFTYCKDL